MKSCNTLSHRQVHSLDTTWARHVGATCVSRGARAYHVTYLLESCPLDPSKYVSRLRVKNVLLPCLPIRDVPLFVSHIMSAASFDLKIATSQQSSREYDLSKQLGSQQVQQMVDYVKFWLSVHLIPTDRLNNLSQNGGNHFDPLSNSRRKL